MKSLYAVLLIAAGFTAPLKAESQAVEAYGPASYPIFKSDSLLRAKKDSLQTHGFYLMLTGGPMLGFSANSMGTGGGLDLSTISGKHFVDLSFGYTSAGSFVVGPSPWLDFFSSGPPTVPEESRVVCAAQYGQRISPNAAWSAGLAYVDRTRNTRTQQVSESSGWFSGGGNWWLYSSERHSYFAAPLSMTLFWRWASWFGAELKGQILVSTVEITGNVGLSIGFGGFPKSAGM